MIRIEYIQKEPLLVHTLAHSSHKGYIIKLLVYTNLIENTITYTVHYKMPKSAITSREYTDIEKAVNCYNEYYNRVGG